jgi:2-dehydro-3-deoxygalactonokinase
MTGEIFSIISQHSILGKDLPLQHFHHETFTLGVNEGQTSQLTQVLFQARTHNLFNVIKKEHIESYLSGLLIGNELQAVTSNSIYLIDNQSLCEKYQLACTALNISASYISGDECFLLGMNTIVQSLNSSEIHSAN